jgi:hypothetical protein
MLPQVLLLLGGAISDRFERRLVLILSDGSGAPRLPRSACSRRTLELGT